MKSNYRFDQANVYYTALPLNNAAQWFVTGIFGKCNLKSTLQILTKLNILKESLRKSLGVS